MAGPGCKTLMQLTNSSPREIPVKALFITLFVILSASDVLSSPLVPRSYGLDGCTITSAQTGAVVQTVAHIRKKDCLSSGNPDGPGPARTSSLKAGLDTGEEKEQYFQRLKVKVKHSVYSFRRSHDLQSFKISEARLPR